jgi:predicted kinase
MNKQTLYLMVGIPGAGKTSAAKLLSAITGAEHIWADHERRKMHVKPTYSKEENDQLYIGLNDQTEKLLKQGGSVVYDTAFNHVSDRQKLRELATRYNAATIVVWVQTPKELAKERAQNTHLHAETRVLGNMTDEHFGNLSNKLEEPTDNETTLVLDGTQLTREYISDALAGLQN